jgi:NAD(P)-dependent dehydrogenase (short-subunit alcohol dehydrogenase family)
MNDESRVFAPRILEGRTALVTGGGSGIGLGIAGCLGASGAKVAIASRSMERLESAAATLRGAGIDTLPLEANVREPDSIRNAVLATADGFGSVDILVNNAAGNFYAPSETLSPNGWRAVVETDLYGTFFSSQAVFPLMRDAGYGRIVSILDIDDPALSWVATDGSRLCGEGRHRCVDPHAGARMGGARDHRQCGRAGADPDGGRAKGVHAAQR